MYELDQLTRGLRHVCRRLFRSTGFTIATVATLALGIGANTAIFTVVNGVLLKPLPFAEPDRLIGVWQTAPGVNIKDLNACIADYFTYREDSRTFADVAIWSGQSATVTEASGTERVDGIAATFRLFPLLGVQPALGRPFEEKDNERGGPEVVMISHGYWQRKFGGDRTVIGRPIIVDGSSREIIGVLPQGMWFMDRKLDLVLPLRFNRSEIRLAGYNFQAIARLRPGVTLAQANEDITRMIGIELRKFPPPKGLTIGMMEDARLGPNARPLLTDLIGDIGKSLWVVMATIGIVLLIACANVANLLLVRTEGRAQELAVRAALGAGRARIAFELLLESIVLALMGGVVGLGFAFTVIKLVMNMSPARLPRFELISIDATSMLMTLVISLAAGLSFGALPVFKFGGASLAFSLRGGGRNASAGPERNIARNALTVLQVGLALVLLIASGLMIRTFDSIRRVDPGFRDPETLQTLRISIPRTAKQVDAEIPRLQQAMVERLRSIPGVSAVGLMNGLPMTGHGSQDPIYASDRTYPANQIPPLRRFITVAPGIFAALGTPLIAGREVTWTEIHEKRPLALVSQNFAKEYWGSADAAVGKHIRSNPNDPWSEIIGVVADVRHDGSDKKAPSTVYWPLRTSNSMAFVLRTSRAGTEGLGADIRQAVWASNPGLPITDVRSMQEIYGRSMSRTSFTLTLLAISGIMALLLAAVGIYAVVSYTVALRTREIGIRMALGAQHGALKMIFVRRGVLWAGIGASVGLVAAAAMSRLMTSLLFEVSPLDPLTYGAVAIGLLAAAALASYIPARRVTRIDPVNALRAD